MSDIVLVIGNKNYSSWSLRPWLLLKLGRIPFSEVRVPLYQENSEMAIRRHSPSGKVPVLRDGDFVVWESLVICEYLAERFPKIPGWPEELRARTMAKALCAEIHAELRALRSELPMNCREEGVRVDLSFEAQREVSRVLQLWRESRKNFGEKGPWLFGEFSIADAFYAPVALRFRSYSIPLGVVEQEYADALLGLEPLQEWVYAAKQEAEVIEKFAVRRQEAES